MPDYANAKIYKITSGDKTYIGSTCEPTLARRLAGHVKHYKDWKRGKRGSMTSFPLIETGEYEITLIELCPCGSKDELNARERFFIETIDCVNKKVPGRTHKEYGEIYRDWHNEINREYYKDHKEVVLERHRQYYETNKDKILEKQRLRREAKKVGS